MNFLFLPHLGLGDQLIMNGYIHYLLKNANPQSILIIAYKNYQIKTLEHLYSDYPIIQFIFVNNREDGLFDPLIESLNGRDFMSEVEYNSNKYILLNFGAHSQFRTGCFPNNSFAETFYIQGRLDPIIRYTHFTLPSNMSNAERIYQNVINKIGTEYIILHDDPSRNFYLDNVFLVQLLRKNNTSDLPVIYLGKNRYNHLLYMGLNNVDVSKEIECDSLLDLYKIFQNAKECHIMDSSIACMIDLMKECNASLHIHNYIRESIDPLHVAFKNKEWNIWYKKNI